VALEQFRTQVLLLHSQQSTLDALGAGFNDRYSVHFATSGSEALTTLGETPIHIIVSAQDLPGMSGLEALREAKKRSPDTIGILLAGDDASDDLEALVGDEEVFQIVRGAVQPDALLKIVENASRRMRMLTLSRSANDNAANVDRSSLVDTISNLSIDDGDDDEGEHIIMETMENGTTMISDGTGRMPKLKPEKIEATPEAGGRGVDVLVLTRDSEFLETVRESARGLHTVHHAVTGQQAQDAVRNHKVGVLVTDAAIAGNKVELLTQNLRRHAPRLVAIVAGRRDDGDSLMELINRGQVYRFLLKPVSPGRARLAIEASVKYHREAPDTSFKAAAPAAPAASRPPPKPAPKPAPAEPAPKPAPEARKPEPRRNKPELAPDEPEATDEPLTASGRLAIPADRQRKPAPAASGSAAGRGRSRPSQALVGGVAAVVLFAGIGGWLQFSGDSGESVDDPAAATAEPRDARPAIADTEAEPVASGSSPEAVDTTATTVPAADAGADAEPAASSGPAADETATESGTGSPAPVEVAAPPQPPAEYVEFLENARLARDSGRILAPAGDNAIEWYVAARDTAPGNEAIAEELGALVEQVIGTAESALLENRLGDAENALGMVELADPRNARLNFLYAQLDQARLRQTLDAARAAIRETRLEDAGQLLVAATQFAGNDTSAIDQLSEELAEARSAQQLDDVLASANARLESGNLTAPANDNARYFFELALTSDPGNAAAQQGLLVVAGKLVLNARAAIDAGDFDRAGALLEDARALDPDGPELAATERALETALAAAAEAEREAELARRAAEREAAERRAAEARRRAAASADLSTPAADAAAQPATAAAAAGDAEAGAPDAEPAAAPEPAEPQPIAVSQLTRVNYVAPRYPRNAQRRNLSGWVDVGFTVTAAGETAEVTVMDSHPGSVFDDAATEAVSKWRFEPVIEDGRPVEKRVAVRMSFSLE